MKTIVAWLVYIVIAVAFWALILWAWAHFVIDPAEARGDARGYTRATALYQPQIAAAQAINARLGVELGGLQQDFAAYMRERDDATARYQAALAVEMQRTIASESEMTRLRGIIARKSSLDAPLIVCQRADAEAARIIDRERKP